MTPILAICRIAILKPSELASVIHSELADVCTMVGLPPSVFDILTGLGSEVGALLVSYPFVGKILFVGSVVIRRKSMEAEAQLMKPVFIRVWQKESHS